MSPPERLLWAQLNGRKLDGFKFRRQHPFDPYILDFYCPEKRLAIEVDGEAHSMGDNPQRDARRDGFMKKSGVRTLRFSAEDVFQDMDAVLRTIIGALSD
jgi:very-short-patch-repair endonuclease